MKYNNLIIVYNNIAFNNDQALIQLQHFGLLGHRQKKNKRCQLLSHQSGQNQTSWKELIDLLHPRLKSTKNSWRQRHQKILSSAVWDLRIYQ